MENIAEKNIRFQTKKPWVFNILPIIYIVIEALGVIPFSLAHGVFKFFGLSLMILMVKGVFKLLHNLTTKIYLTNDKITISTGYINKNVIDISLDKSESIWVSQSLFGKIFNYGSVSIITAGMNISQFINNPMEFRNLINNNTL